MTNKIDLLRQAVAQGWCHETTSHKEMDVVLAEAIAQSAIAALPAVNTDPIGYISAVTDPQIATLQATNARLVEALRFYGGVMPASFAPGQDGGYRARALLSELEAK